MIRIDMYTPTQLTKIVKWHVDKGHCFLQRGDYLFFYTIQG